MTSHPFKLIKFPLSRATTPVVHIHFISRMLVFSQHLVSRWFQMLIFGHWLDCVLEAVISVTETITETEIIDPALTETETMLIYETEIL